MIQKDIILLELFVLYGENHCVGFEMFEMLNIITYRFCYIIVIILR